MSTPRSTGAACGSRRLYAFGLAAVAIVVLSGARSSGIVSNARAQTAVPTSRTYTTTGFLAKALTVQLQRPWKVIEDSRLHLSVAASDPNYRVLWSMDASALHAGKKVAGVASVAGPLIRWLRNNRNLRVVEAKRSTVGPKLVARVVDVSLTAGAVNDDPSCPASTCVNFLRFYGAGEPYGIAGDDAMRFYLANIKYKGRRHLLIIAIEARDRADLAVRRPAAERLIHTARLALTPG
jgi:hypothetical protein